MTLILRRRIIAALVVAVLSLSIVSQVLPQLPNFGGVAYADHCGSSSC